MKKNEKIYDNNSRTIVHLICCEKFTSGYINCMKMKLAEYNHYFIVYGEKYQINIVDNNNVVRLSSYRNIIFDYNCRKLLKSAEKIIVSGVFGVERFFYILPSKIWNKIYLQFWGGDFYVYRKNDKNFKEFLYRQIMTSCIKRCAAVITLVAGDYLELEKIFNLNKKHYVVPMPFDPQRKIDMDKLRIENKNFFQKKSIVLGNSATEENQHIEALNKIKHLRNEDIIIYCPLSYGNENYRDKVILYGKEIFGDKFIPIVEYMEYIDYINFLAKCDVGIFNNNRQQAMGNIYHLAELGKKIYIRNDTTMWSHFAGWGLKLYSVSELESIELADLFQYSEEEINNNSCVMKTKEKEFLKAWKMMLSD